MQSNVPMTPQVADIAAAFLEAVHAVLADPDGAAEAVAKRNAAHKLSLQEVAQLEKDRAFMADAAARRKEHDEWLAQKESWEKETEAAEEQFRMDEEEHARNVDNLAVSISEHNKAKLALDKRELKLKNDLELLAADRREHELQKAMVKTREDKVKKREDSMAKWDQTLREAASKAGS